MAFLDRDEVGQQPAQPALIDIKHPAALSLFLDGILGLALGPQEENRLSVRAEFLNKLHGIS